MPDARAQDNKIDRALFNDLVETMEIGSLCALGVDCRWGEERVAVFPVELDGYFR